MNIEGITIENMTEEKGSVEENVAADESMAESDTVNPLYALATSTSDHSSLGRQHTSASVDQAANETTRAQTSVSISQPDSTSTAARPSSVNKTGLPSSGSFPSLSALQISRPPQTSAGSEEPQPVKVQPAPVVPIRLVRAPPSTKPASNIPKVNCPEKLVSCLKLDIWSRYIATVVLFIRLVSISVFLVLFPEAAFHIYKASPISVCVYVLVLNILSFNFFNSQSPYCLFVWSCICKTFNQDKTRQEVY